MNEFISQAVSSLGVTEGQAKQGASGLLGMIQSAMGGDLQKTLGGVPALKELIPAGGEGAEGGGGGGMLGGLLKSATSMLGGGGEAGVAGAISALTSSGLSADKAGPFATLLMKFIKEKAGDGALKAILAKVPQLASLAG